MKAILLLKPLAQTSGETKFREDLKVYFPDLYAFWSLFQFDPYYQQVLEAILEMTKENASGKIEVFYQSGRIQNVYLQKLLTAGKGKLTPSKESD
jgi:hypothetical protein